MSYRYVCTVCRTWSRHATVVLAEDEQLLHRRDVHHGRVPMGEAIMWGEDQAPVLVRLFLRWSWRVRAVMLAVTVVMVVWVAQSLPPSH